MGAAVTGLSDDKQPDPACLEMLLRDLGVTLEQVERLIEEEGAGRPAQGPTCRSTPASRPPHPPHVPYLQLDNGGELAHSPRRQRFTAPRWPASADALEDYSELLGRI